MQDEYGAANRGDEKRRKLTSPQLGMETVTGRGDRCRDENEGDARRKIF